MRLAGRLALGILAIAAGSVAALAQSEVISARSGLIHYVEGTVYLDGQLAETKFGTFPEVKENQQLKTEAGRAEVLLTPGVFLRLGENSSFRMITNRLIDTRLEFLSGNAVVEAEDIGKDNSVTVVYKDATVHPVRKGIYRFDSSSGELRVYDGLAQVTLGDQTVEVKEGRAITLHTLAVQKFDKAHNDALDRWSERRAGYVSMANVGAASALSNSIYSGGFGGNLFAGGWFLNPSFGMYSYVPGLGGMFYNSYGCPMFSPFDVYMAYAPGFYSPCNSGFFSPGYYSPGYGGAYSAYNTLNYKSVPPPKRSSGPGSGLGTGGSFAGLRGSSSGSLPASSSLSSPVNSAPASHGGGGAVGGSSGSHR
jgi:hypothetical protein